MPTRHAWAALLALLSLAAPAVAQQGKRYALLVGVTEYDSSTFTTLKYAENDAEKLAEVLKDAGYDEAVVLTTSRGKKDKALVPTAANVRAALEKLSGKVKKDDLLLIALSGHGVQWPVLDEKTKKEKDESFFCPSDARPRSDQTLAQLKKTMIPVGELFRTLEESGAGVRLMLVDACRNEVKGEGRNIDVDNLPRTKKGTAVLFSCKGGERAFEAEKYKHGVFFHHVIDALKVKKNLTWSQLADHVTDKVTEDVPELIGGGAKQTPHEMKNLEGRSPLLLPSAGKEADRLFGEAMDVILSDRQRATNLLRQASTKGNTLANCWIGLILTQDKGTEKDKAEGLKAVEKALPAVRQKTEGGDADAQDLLGLLYVNGVGVEKDEKQAVEWCVKAANNGSACAMVRLGSRYGGGRGVDKDGKKSIEWLQKAADKGQAIAMVDLGKRYADGRDVEKDVKKAIEWLTKAAAKGHAGGMFYLGLIYRYGKGVEKDGKKATEWFKKAADKGDVIAMISLGEMYADGDGVDRDPAAALKWLQMAADLGDEKAKLKVAELKAKD